MWTVHTLKWPDYRNRRRPDVRHCVCGSTYRWSTRLCLFIQLDVVVQFKSVKLIHHQSPPHTLVSLSTRTFLPILMFPLTFSVNSACMLVLAFIYILLAISHHSGPEWWNLCHWHTVWPHRKVAWVWYKKKWCWSHWQKKSHSQYFFPAVWTCETSTGGYSLLYLIYTISINNSTPLWLSLKLSDWWSGSHWQTDDDDIKVEDTHSQEQHAVHGEGGVAWVEGQPATETHDSSTSC